MRHSILTWDLKTCLRKLTQPTFYMYVVGHTAKPSQANITTCQDSAPGTRLVLAHMFLSLDYETERSLSFETSLYITGNRMRPELLE